MRLPRLDHRTVIIVRGGAGLGDGKAEGDGFAGFGRDGGDIGDQGAQTGVRPVPLHLEQMGEGGEEGRLRAAIGAEGGVQRQRLPAETSVIVMPCMDGSYRAVRLPNGRERRVAVAAGTSRRMPSRTRA